jgi:hypothetical protein
MSAVDLSLQSAPFSQELVDVAEVNATASRVLLERASEVRASASGPGAAETMGKAFALLGPAGGGKTHVFARLRHETSARVSLVLLRPFFGVPITPRDVLGAAIDQLCLPVQKSALSQLDRIAAFWLGDEASAEFPSASIEDVRNQSAEDNAQQLEAATAKVLARAPSAEPMAHAVSALLQLGDRDRASRWAELSWLSGREVRSMDGRDAAALGESDVLCVLRVLSVMAAPVAPLFLVFDQLENLAGDGDERVLSYGNLVAELVDTVPSLTVVQLALTSEWMQHIEPRLTLPQRSRVAREIMTLEAPSPEQREQLLRRWHAHLAPENAKGGKRRFPAPLGADELEVLRTAPGMTPRLLLTALLRAIDGKPALEPAREERAGDGGPDGAAATAGGEGASMADLPGPSLYEVEMDKVRASLVQHSSDPRPLDAAELAEALTAGLSFVASMECTSRGERGRVLTRVCVPGHELTLVFANGRHHASVSGALAKAAELASDGKTVIVRQASLPVPATWSTVAERRVAFEANPNARWLSLEDGDVVSLVALARLLSQARAQRLLDPRTQVPLTEAELRERLLREGAPAQLRPVMSVQTWLSDVPRAPAKEAVRREQDVPRASAAVPEVAEDKGTGEAQLPSAREWIRQGVALGRRALGEYRDKLRRR